MASKIWAYKNSSGGAKALSEALGIKRIKHEGSRYRPKVGDKIINWGSSQVPEYLLKAIVFNKPEAVGIASNKLLAFKELDKAGISIPVATTDKEKAKELFEGKDVVCRHKLTGHSGEGIEIIGKREWIPDSKLYVEYIPKTQEYRVHVVKEQIVDIQRKARDKGVPDEEVNWKVRNHKNGFVYAREGGIELPEHTKYMCIKAVASLGLDFGAVDLVYNEKRDRYYVLEVNTAPGLFGTTLERYVEAFKEVL